MLDFSDRTRTGISILTSAADHEKPNFGFKKLQLQAEKIILSHEQPIWFLASNSYFLGKLNHAWIFPLFLELNGHSSEILLS